MMQLDTDDLYEKTIAAVSGGKNKPLVIEFTDGTEAEFDVYGDCCSVSWIEHLEVPPDIAGARFYDAYQVDMDEPPGVDWSGHDCLSFYAAHFVTSRGLIIAEFRNDSNGYYGGQMFRVKKGVSA